jgi:hypothetical protein
MNDEIERNELGEYVLNCFLCGHTRFEKRNGPCGPFTRYFCTKKNEYLKTTPTFIPACGDYVPRIGDMKEKPPSLQEEIQSIKRKINDFVGRNLNKLTLRQKRLAFDARNLLDKIMEV